MKKHKKILLSCSALALSLSLAGCGDKVNRTSQDGNEQKVEHAAIQLVNSTEKGKYKLIDSTEVKKNIDDNKSFVLVNTIPSDRFTQTKIKGSVNAPLPKKLEEVKPEEKEKFLKSLGEDKDKMIIVYCGYVECERSHVGATLAVQAGYKNVYRYPGGIAAWLDSGNSIDK